MRIPKVFNFRFFLVGFALFVLGVFVALSFFVSLWFLIAFVIALCAVVILFVVQKWYKSILNLKRIFALFICFVLGMFSFSISELVYAADVPKTGFYFVTARVASVEENKLDQTSFETTLDNVVLKSENGKTEKLMNSVVFLCDQKLEVGDKISLSAKFVAQEHFPDWTYISSKNCGKLAYASKLQVLDGKKLYVSDRVKIAAWNVLDKNMDRDEAGILFSMVFGDKSKLLDDTRGEFMASGIGHILAVSGLHVGFFVFLISLLFNAFKINKKVKFAVVSLGLLLYCWLCGFSYSVLRASIMCIVCLYAGIRGRQYDGLSSLCFSSLLVLTFDPFQLFSVGFLLSFFSVLAMFCLSKVFGDLFGAGRSNKIAGSLVVGISTSIGIFPWIAHFFGYFAPYSIVLNVVLIPVASLAYMLCFVLTILALPVKSLGVLLHAPEYIVKGINWVCKFANELPLASIEANIHPATIVVWFVAVGVSCDYCLAKRKHKLLLSVGCWGVAVLLAVLNMCKVF